MKKITLLLVTLILSASAFSQMPAWTNYNTRQEMYPEDEYLVAFVSGRNTNDDDPGKIKSVYESLAKDKIIQNIMVEIESNNTLNISNVNGKSGEEFLSKSVSISRADVAGLTTKSYYDRKKKEIYAISFVNRKELAFYYRNQIKSGREAIEQKLKEGREYVKKDNKENALRSFYETMPLFQKCDEARVLLIALNRKMFADIDSDEINQLRLDVINEIDKLVQPNNLTLEESAYFISYGLYLQLQNNGTTIESGDITFENSGLTSMFSQKLADQMKRALVDAGNYTISDSKSSEGYKLSGNYWKEGSFIKISAKIFQWNKLIAVSNGSLPLKWLENNNVKYIPDAVVKLEALKGASLEVLSYPPMVKSGMETTVPVNVKLVRNNQGQTTGIPIAVYGKNSGKLLGSDVTSVDGTADIYMSPFESDSRIYPVRAGIDLEKYLNISSTDIFYSIAERTCPVQSVIIDLELAKPTIALQSNERASGRHVDVPTLAPVVKQTLSELGYNFTDNKSDADYIVKIDANTTTSTQYQGIHFAYLDINFVVEDTRDGKETYATHIDQIKGGGANDSKASKKAYALGAEKLKEELKKVEW